VNKFLKVAGIATLVAIVGMVAVAGFALAQGPTDQPSGWLGPGPGLGFGPRGGGDWSTFDAAAEALGLTPDELFSELHSGKTLSDLATQQGVDQQTVQDAINAARTAAEQQAIEQAVTDGRISRQQADWMLQGLQNGWLGGPGLPGHGRGPGGMQPGDQGQSQGSRFQQRLVVPSQSL
jgi:hypothetical protein